MWRLAAKQLPFEDESTKTRTESTHNGDGLLLPLPTFLLEVSSQSAGAAMCYESFQPRTAMVSGTMSDDARYTLSKLNVHLT